MSDTLKIFDKILSNIILFFKNSDHRGHILILFNAVHYSYRNVT